MAFPFHVMRGPDVAELLAADRPGIVELVRETYLAHHDGATVNPSSHFLRFPDDPAARIIALPAALRGTDAAGPPGVAGIKWIASFPGNVERNLPRASAVLVLNDLSTGYPFAVLEAAAISAARTAASAALAAEALHGSRAAAKVAVVGAGVIARTVLDFLHAQRWRIDGVAVYDAVPEYADRLASYADGLGWPGTVADKLGDAVDGADVVVLATTAATPYILDPGAFVAGQTVLNLSLRDIGPELIAAAHNVLDDVEHCLTAGTSPHLAAQAYGHREFVDGTIAELLRGQLDITAAKPRIFSPFGLGVLDLAVGLRVFRAGLAAGRCLAVADFYATVERW
ncbi:2,3-diaminopropionate biosynthesis protein SbnB [Dactylosporangium sp. NPDC048998]|uniref:2,3-diaminopropionate biosynthesis protein SbnB n=1 Tax=Dactylosporangium sp. NPDC048998 TaxID=3363976 RepID=UPI0037104F19